MALFKIAIAVLAALSAVEGLAFTKRQDLSFDYDGEKVRGVNLGGWFVLESWITPSLFNEWANNEEAVDEYTFCQVLGPQEAYNRLSAHWNTWITEADFQEIASIGLNHVRIPIGYWAINAQAGDPYVQGQLPILDQAIVWARNAGLKVIIDLHGAPGSQNGFDNSGRRGPIEWQSGTNNVAQTLVAIKMLNDRYAGDSDVVPGFELVNEPLGPELDMDAVKQFYWDGYGNLRINEPFPAVMIHDAFEDIVSFWNSFMDIASGAYNVILDTHIYQVFNDAQVALTPAEHIAQACSWCPKVAQTDKWLIVGEWTGAQTDCARWLNGLGLGARYDGTFDGGPWYGNCENKSQGTVDDMLPVDKTNIRMFIEAQLDAYECHSGWIFWTWKTEAAPEWDMQGLAAAGLFPVPPIARQYPHQCGF